VGLYIPAILNIVVSVIGAYYYLRIVKIMYFDEPARPFDRDIGRGLGTVMAAATAFSILFVFVPGALVETAGVAAAALFK
jgi:NADH-quinone oxidoreductase subunit N